MRNLTFPYKSRQHGQVIQVNSKLMEHRKVCSPLPSFIGRRGLQYQPLAMTTSEMHTTVRSVAI